MAAQRRASVMQEPAHVATPKDRPSETAQWDEVHGCWMEFDPAAGTWVPVDGESDALGPAPADDHGAD